MSQSITFQPPEHDAYVFSTGTADGTGTSILTGYFSTYGGYGRGLVKFSTLTSIAPVDSVTSAILSLYAFADDSAASAYLRVYRNTADFDESTITWATKPSYDGTYIASTTLGTNDRGFINFSLDTTVIKNIINGVYPNYGFTFISQYESGTNSIYHWYSSKYATAANRPKLAIEYMPLFGGQPAISPFFNFFKNFENPRKKKGGIWQPENGLATI